MQSGGKSILNDVGGRRRGRNFEICAHFGRHFSKNRGGDSATIKRSVESNRFDRIIDDDDADNARAIGREVKY